MIGWRAMLSSAMDPGSERDGLIAGAGYLVRYGSMGFFAVMRCAELFPVWPFCSCDNICLCFYADHESLQRVRGLDYELRVGLARTNRH